MSVVKPKRSRSELFVAYKRAFEDVFGDPLAKPESFSGQYQILKSRGQVAAMKNNFDEGKATRNPASPHIIDFFCDVENIVTRNLSADELERFTNTYIYELRDGGLTDQERSDIEQRLGRLFRARKISPVNRYFKTVRQAGVSRRK